MEVRDYAIFKSKDWKYGLNDLRIFPNKDPNSPEKRKYLQDEEFQRYFNEVMSMTKMDVNEIVIDSYRRKG